MTALAVGRSAFATRTCSAADLHDFAAATGAASPIIADAQQAPTAWIAALFDAAFAALAPSLRCQSQNLRFAAPVRVGDTARAAVEVTAVAADGLVTLACRMTGADGAVVAAGEAEARAPAHAPAAEKPRIVPSRFVHFTRLLAACAPLAPLKTAVVAPEEPVSLGGALAAADAGLIDPILIGDPAAIRAAAMAGGIDLRAYPIVAMASGDAAAAEAVRLVNAGAAAALMKGALHTDVLLHHVVKRDGGLRTSRRITHDFVFDVPGLPHLLHVADAAITIAPTLEDKVDIVQNAIDLARALGCATPRVGILCAVETVNPKMPATIDAAALSKMAERGQITGGLVDGPLAMDNAVDAGAAGAKGLRSAVAGRADILIAPNIEAGNILAKELAYISHGEGAGLVMGARAPIILTSRADDEIARLMSCAVAVLYEDWRRTGAAKA